MNDIIAGDPAPTNPTALGEFVGCSGNDCQRGEWSAKADERGWEQPVSNRWLCPQCAANAADRANFIASQKTARDELLLLDASGEWPGFIGRILAKHRAEVLAEAADHIASLLEATPEYGLWVANKLRAMAAAGGESRG